MSSGVPAYSSDDRPLPEGWIREYDAKFNHFYYVNTRAQPPVTIWEHPLDLGRSEEKEAADLSSSTPISFPTPVPATPMVPAASSSASFDQDRDGRGRMGQSNNFASDRRGDGGYSSASAPYPNTPYAPPPSGPAPNVYVVVNEDADSRGRGGRHGGRRRRRGGPLSMIIRAVIKKI